jgi:carboxymethylenebutenolidase
MNLKPYIQHAMFGACLGCLTLGVVVSAASAQSNALNLPKPGMSEALDHILAAEKPLGDDSWRTQMLLSAFSQDAQQQPTQNPPPQQRTSQGWSKQQTSQAWAAKKLAGSPRRNEWVTVPNGNRKLKGWVVYPGARGKVPVVLVIHEVFGLTDSTRNTADEIAAMGYIAITPDMLSGYGPNNGNSDSFEPPYSASDTNTGFSDDAVNSDLNAWADYAAKLPGSNGNLAIVGLSWGGGAAFRYVVTQHRKDLKLICVFYDVGPPAETQKYYLKNGPAAPMPVADISVPVYGFYPSQDARPMKSIQATKDAMAGAGKTYDPVVYERAEHAFMRIGEDPANPNPANAEAAKASLARLEKLLKAM